MYRGGHVLEVPRIRLDQALVVQLGGTGSARLSYAAPEAVAGVM